MKLSICVPTLNRDEYIIDMVKSISGKNLKDIELVVVDGGKSTETEKIILDNINPDIKFNYMTSELNQGMDLDVVQAVENAKAGQVQYRTDKAGIIHCSIGRASFDADKLQQNLTTLIDALNKAKPASAKGVFIKKVSISSTMGAGIKVDQANLLA